MNTNPGIKFLLMTAAFSSIQSCNIRNNDRNSNEKSEKVDTEESQPDKVTFTVSESDGSPITDVDRGLENGDDSSLYEYCYRAVLCPNGTTRIDCEAYSTRGSIVKCSKGFDWVHCQAGTSIAKNSCY